MKKQLLFVPKLLWTPVRGVVRTVSVVPRALEAVLILPKLVEQLDRVNDELRGVRSDTEALALVWEELAAVRHHTASLPHVDDELQGVRKDTGALYPMLDELRTVRGDTACLPLVRDELAAMRERLVKIEANTLAVEQLAEVAVPLQGAALRVGRLADRFPQRRNGR